MIEQIQHVYLINDLEEHLLETVRPLDGEPYCECACGAINIIDGGNLIIKHNSFDGREAFEFDNPVRQN